MRFLLPLVVVASLTLAACSGDPTPATPTSEATPTATATATPTPTPTPTPTANEVLDRARNAVTATDSLRFSFALSGPPPKMAGTGEWAAPDQYHVATEVEACPPPVPGVADPTDCGFVPLSDVYAVGEYEFATATSGPGDWTITSNESGGWGLGPWSGSFDFERYGFSLGDSPWALIASLLERATSRDTALGITTGSTAFHVTADGPSAAYAFDIAHDSFELTKATITTAGEPPNAWTWTFSGRGSRIVVAAPVEAPPASVLDWLTTKQVEVVYRRNFVNPELGLAEDPLWPDLVRDRPVITALTDALADAEVVAPGDLRHIGGPVLVVRYTDGSLLQVSQATRSTFDVTTSRTTIIVVEDHWYVAAVASGGSTEGVVRSADLSTWWSQVPENMPEVELVEWPSSARLGEPLVLTGRGWPDANVTVRMWTTRGRVELGVAPTEHGSFRWEGALAQPLAPGEYRFEVRNQLSLDPSGRSFILEEALITVTR